MTDIPISPRFISASGRSGSTWVQDCLAQANGCVTLFEPLHEERTREAHAHAFRYLHEDDADAELERFFDGVFRGEIGRLWARYRINRKHFWHGPQVFLSYGKLHRQIAKYRRLYRNYRQYRGEFSGPAVVKFIRANCMIGWLARTYRAPSMVLLRHPCAVAESKRRMAIWSSDFALERYYADPRLADALAGIALPDYRTLGQVSRFVLHWCIETRVALDQAQRCGIPVIFYERLVADPDREWRRAADALGLDKAPDESVTRRRSQQAAGEGKDGTYDLSFLIRWRERLSGAEREEARAMLELFRITYYSVDGPMPEEGRP